MEYYKLAETKKSLPINLANNGGSGDLVKLSEKK